MIKRLTIEPYATDVISEYGNNTWYYKGETIKLYVPSEGNVYYRPKGAENWTTISNSSDLVTVPSAVSNTAGNYEFTTNTENAVYANINVVDTGAVSYADGVISASGYSDNLTPVWYQLYAITNEDADCYYEVETPEKTDTGKKLEIIESVNGESGCNYMIESESGAEAEIPVPTGRWVAQIYYQTGYGYCHKEVYPY